MLCELLEPNAPFKIKSKPDSYFSLHNVALDLKSQVTISITEEAALFLILESKEILIIEMSRELTGVKSSNINLDFESDCDVVLISKGGSVHIIGGFRPKNTTTSLFAELRKKEETTETIIGKEIEDQGKLSEVDTSREEEKPNTLRRSSRVRTVAPVENNNKSVKKEKEALKNMAHYFDCGDLDDDEEDSYSQQNEESSSESESEDSSKMEEEFSEDSRLGRKKKTVNSQEKKIKPQTSQKRETKTKESGSLGDFSVPTKNPYG